MTEGNQSIPHMPEKDKFATLKAWAYWAKLNPLDEDQELMAKEVNDLFALLGTKEAKLLASEERAERYQVALEKIADPRKRHKESDAYTELGCVMNIANEALRDG